MRALCRVVEANSANAALRDVMNREAVRARDETQGRSFCQKQAALGLKAEAPTSVLGIEFASATELFAHTARGFTTKGNSVEKLRLARGICKFWCLLRLQR